MPTFKDDTCSRGHHMTPKTMRVRIDKHGRVQRQCKLCEAITRNARRKQKRQEKGGNHDSPVHHG